MSLLDVLVTLFILGCSAGLTLVLLILAPFALIARAAWVRGV